MNEVVISLSHSLTSSLAQVSYTTGRMRSTQSSGKANNVKLHWFHSLAASQWVCCDRSLSDVCAGEDRLEGEFTPRCIYSTLIPHHRPHMNRSFVGIFPNTCFPTGELVHQENNVSKVKALLALEFRLNR